MRNRGLMSLALLAILTVALAHSHDHGPVSINSLYGVGEQPVHGVFELVRVNAHDDRRRIGDEFDLNPPAAR